MINDDASVTVIGSSNYLGIEGREENLLKKGMCFSSRAPLFLSHHQSGDDDDEEKHLFYIKIKKHKNFCTLIEGSIAQEAKHSFYITSSSSYGRLPSKS